MYRQQQQYDTNPFSQLQTLPYISQRVDQGFLDDKLKGLQHVEQQKQLAEQQLDTYDLALSKLDAYGEIGNEVLENKKKLYKERLNSLTQGEYGLADPNIRSKLRFIAKDFVGDEELKHIQNFYSQMQQDNELRNKTRGTVDVDLPKQDMFTKDDEGNLIPTEYNRNWEEKYDYGKEKLGFLKSIKEDITQQLGLPSNISDEELFIAIKETNTGEISTDKLDSMFMAYTDSLSGSQEILSRATEKAKQARANGEDVTRNDFIEEAEKELKEEFARLGSTQEYSKEGIRLLQNPLFGTTPDNPTDTSGFLTKFVSDSHSYSGVFPDIKDFNNTIVDNTHKGLMKESLGNALLQDPEIKQSYIDLIESLPEEERKKYFKNGVIKNTDELETFINNIGESAAKQNKGNLKQSVKLHELLSIPVSEWAKGDVDRANESYTEYLDLVEKYKQYNDLVSDRFSTVIKNMNDDIAIIPFGHNFNNKEASSAFTNMNKEFKRVINRAKVEGEEDLKVESVDGIFRYGTSIKFYGKDENGEDKVIDFDNAFSKQKMLEYFNSPVMDLANEWEGFKVAEDKVFYVDKNGQEKSLSLPEGLKVKTKMMDNGRFVITLFDENNNPIPIKYINYDGASYNDFQEYSENVYSVPYQDAHYILSEIFGSPDKIKFKND